MIGLSTFRAAIVYILGCLKDGGKSMNIWRANENVRLYNMQLARQISFKLTAQIGYFHVVEFCIHWVIIDMLS